MKDTAVQVLEALYVLDDVIDRIDDDGEMMQKARAALRTAIPLAQGMSVATERSPWHGWPTTLDLQLSRLSTELLHAAGRPGCDEMHMRMVIAQVQGALWRIRRDLPRRTPSNPRNGHRKAGDAIVTG